ncbi:MAG: Pvc16 family protein [Vicinamibacterales bacterium]
MADGITGHVGQVPIEADLLISAHAPPQRWFDAVRLLEAACTAIRANPHLDGPASRDTVEIVFRPAAIDEITGVWCALRTPLQPSVLCALRVTPAGSTAVAPR